MKAEKMCNACERKSTFQQGLNMPSFKEEMVKTLGANKTLINEFGRSELQNYCKKILKIGKGSHICPLKSSKSGVQHKKPKKKQ